MSVHLVTFSDDNMDRSSRRCVESGKANGVYTHCRFNPGNIGHYAVTMETVKAHRDVFRQPSDARRAWGWWAWKPLIISAELENLPEGSALIYSDAGVEFTNNVNYIIDRMDQDIFLFGNMYEHAHWCKRDIVEEIWPLPIDRQSFIDAGIAMSTPDCIAAFDVDSIANLYSWARFGKQAQASVIFFRVNDKTRAFVKEWLGWCLFEGGRLIDDSPSRSPNHPEFQENRHDQAILTTMAYRDGYRLHWWPASYNDGAFTYERGDYPDEGYPVMFNHHRRRNHEWSNAA